MSHKQVHQTFLGKHWIFKKYSGYFIIIHQTPPSASPGLTSLRCLCSYCWHKNVVMLFLAALIKKKWCLILVFVWKNVCLCMSFSSKYISARARCYWDKQGELVNVHFGPVTSHWHLFLGADCQFLPTHTDKIFSHKFYYCFETVAIGVWKVTKLMTK